MEPEVSNSICVVQFGLLPLESRIIELLESGFLAGAYAYRLKGVLCDLPASLSGCEVADQCASGVFTLD
jgi:hypothetical protein